MRDLGSIRTPVGIAECDNGMPLVVCDDGAAFRSLGSDGWAELPPIPGTLAERLKGVSEPRTVESDMREGRW